MNASPATLASRIRAVRLRRFGDDVAAAAARAGVPEATWRNYEAGVKISAEPLLAFLEATGASPSWLLGGRGPMLAPCACGGHPSGPGQARTEEATGPARPATAIPVVG